MSIENDLGRIASALEGILAHLTSSAADAPAPKPKAAQAKSEPKAEAKPEPKSAGKAKAADPEIPYDKVREAVVAVLAAKGREAVVEILKQFGVGKAQDLKAAQYADAITAFTSALTAEDDVA